MPNLYFTRDPGACVGNGICSFVHIINNFYAIFSENLRKSIVFLLCNF